MIGVVEAVDAPGCGFAPGDIALTLAPYHQAMAEYYLAPVEHVLVLPKGKPLDQLLMAQQLGTVIYACQRLPNLIGKRVAVIGLGSAGPFSPRCAAGWAPSRSLRWTSCRTGGGRGALRRGPDAINNVQVDPLQAVTEITGGTLADVVIEAGGRGETINLPSWLVKTNGHILFFGIPRAYDFMFDYETFFRKYATTTSIAGAAFEPGEKSSWLALDLVGEWRDL